MNPDLSVILGACGGYKAVRATVQRLKRQSCAEKMELIVVGVEGVVEVPPEDAAVFWGCQTIQMEHAVSVGAANAEGVRRARAPVVVFGEDHCFPEAGWAEALIEAHRQPYTVVGPVFRNANPRTTVSWCDFLLAYGPWMYPSQGGFRTFLPGHNSSYKRAELLAYGDRLEEALEMETVLHFEMASKGHKLYLEPRARVSHLNFAILSVWLKVQFYVGWSFAGHRATGWPAARRLFYVLAWPLIPVMRFVHVVRELFAPGRPSGLLWRITPMLLFGLAVDGVGQFLGYSLGPRQSAANLRDYEYNRIRFVTAAERDVTSDGARPATTSKKPR